MNIIKMKTVQSDGNDCMCNTFAILIKNIDNSYTVIEHQNWVGWSESIETISKNFMVKSEALSYFENI